MRISAAAIAALLVASPALAAPPLYVSCEDGGAIAVVDTATDAVIATWPAGKRPRGLLPAPRGGRLYVALSGSPKGGPGIDEAKLPPPDRTADGIGVFDAHGKRLRVLSSGQDPESFDLSADGRRLFVSNEETAHLSIVDVASGRVRAAVAVGREPEGVRVRPDGRAVYVTSEGDDAVFVVDPVHAKVIARIPTPPRPRVILFSPDGARAYVSSENGAAVTVVDAARNLALARIAIPNDGTTMLGVRPMGLALSADGRTLFVANGRGGTVSVVDTAAAKVVRTIANVGARPWGIALSPDGSRLYTANGPSNDVSVIDVAAGRVLEHIPTCRGPWGVSFGR